MFYQSLWPIQRSVPSKEENTTKRDRMPPLQCRVEDIVSREFSRTTDPYCKVRLPPDKQTIHKA